MRQAVLQSLERPLLCSSVHVDAEGELEIVEGPVMLDMYAGRGIDFLVDCGSRVAEGSTVIDLSEREPVLIRQGKGDASAFVRELAYT
jgi:tRNA A37 threonylcarbamoyladenosine synthetase subunit TsaC/SUA5/YrdC